jgi:hypothetical protein
MYVKVNLLVYLQPVYGTLVASGKKLKNILCEQV